MKNLLKGALLIGAGAAIGYFVGKKINESKKEEKIEEVEKTIDTAEKVAKVGVTVGCAYLGFAFLECLVNNIIAHENEINRLTGVTQTIYLAVADLYRQTGTCTEEEFKSLINNILQLPDDCIDFKNMAKGLLEEV